MESAPKAKATRGSRRSLQRVEILRGRERFRQVLHAGRRVPGTYIRGYILSVDSGFNAGVPVRVGFAVSRQIKSAVHRNRVRRLMREAYRPNKEKLLWFARKRKAYLSLVFLFTENENRNVRKVKLADIEKDVQRVLEAALAIE